MAAKQVDWSALYAKDPILQATLASITGQGVQQQGALTQARQQALIGYGSVPDATTSPALSSLLGGIAPDITQSTRDLAQQSTASGLSTLAQLQHGYQQQQQGSVANLAGRGMLRSGEYRQDSLENIHNLQTNEANAQQTLLGNLAGLWSGYQGQQQANTTAAQSATSDALTRILGGINAGTIASPTSPSGSSGPDPSLVSGYNPVGNIVAGVPKPPPTYGNRPVPVIPRRTPTATAPTAPRPLQ